MKSNLRESIRKQIKKILKEAAYGGPGAEYYEREKEEFIKKMEEFHRKENESYEEYKNRMMKKHGWPIDYHRQSKFKAENPDYSDYSGTFWEAMDEWYEYCKEKEEKEKERKEKENQERYKSYRPIFDKALEDLKSLPFYEEVMKELEGKIYDETLLDALICYKNKKAGNSLKRWIDNRGFLVFTENGIHYQNEDLTFYDPSVKDGRYARLVIKRKAKKGYHEWFQVSETLYYVKKSPQYNSYNEPLPDDYYHSKRE